MSISKICLPQLMQDDIINNLNPIISNLKLSYTLSEYNNELIPNINNYSELYTTEIFTILPELYRYVFVNTLIISIGKKNAMQNSDLLFTENIKMCPSITKLIIRSTIKLPFTITQKLFALFPNLTHLFIETYPGNNNTRFRTIDILSITNNIKHLSLFTTLDDANIDFICSLKNLKSLQIYMVKQFTDSQYNKLNVLANSLNLSICIDSCNKALGEFSAGNFIGEFCPYI